MILVTVEHARDHEITNRDQYLFDDYQLAIEQCAKTVRAVLDERLQAGNKSVTEDVMRGYLEQGNLKSAVKLFGEYFTYPNFTLSEIEANEEMPVYIKEPDSPEPWMGLQVSYLIGELKNVNELGNSYRGWISFHLW